MLKTSNQIHYFAAIVAVFFLLQGSTGLCEEAAVAAPSETRVLIKQGNMLGIDVFKEKDLSGNYRVGETGNIVFPMVGEIKAADLSIDDFRASLGESLKKFIKEPMINVDFVRETKLKEQSDVVLVLGQVKTQGAQVITDEGSSLLKAIAQAGGFSAIANPRVVKVVSRHGGSRKTVMYNLYDVLDSRIEDPAVFAGDVVYVGESTF